MRLSVQRLKSIAIAVAVSAAVFSGQLGGALAQEEDEEAFESKVMRALLGTPRGDIEYRERSPLVIPPARDLPPPEASTGPGPLANPAWPKDPDVAKRTKSAAAPAIDAERESGRRLTPDEMRRGTVSASRRDKPVVSPSDNESGRPMLPSEYNPEGKFTSLFNMFGAKPKPETFAEEPTRSRMTQPPPGYRTPSPTQPYAPPKEESWFKMPSVFDRGTDR
jgi:hypothetical protein